MHIVAKSLGPDMSRVSPAIHELSGCHLASAFFGIGKQKKDSIPEGEHRSIFFVTYRSLEMIRAGCNSFGCANFFALREEGIHISQSPQV